jgi:hypothetical protein
MVSLRLIVWCIALTIVRPHSLSSAQVSNFATLVVQESPVLTNGLCEGQAQ